MQNEDDIRRRAQQAALSRIRPPVSDWDRTWTNARNAASTPVPPELRNIAIGEDYDRESPGLYRIRPQSGGVSIESLRGRLPDLSPRAPMDERLPDGKGVQDLLREKSSLFSKSLNSDAALAQPTQPAPRISVSSQPAAGIIGSLNLPQPTSEIRPVEVPPNPSEMPTTASPSGFLGPSIHGRSQLDRNLLLRDTMADADPESQVRVRGEQIDVGPPGMKGVNRRSRWATAGEATINALGSGDPDRPLYSLGQAIGAGLTGAVSPRSGAKINRRFDLSRLDNDIARGLKLENAQSDLASAEALRRQRELEPILQARKIEQETEYRNQQLELERQKAAGAISQREYEHKRDELNRQSRENVAAANRASQEKIAGMRDNGSDSRAAKAQAAQSEYDQLVKDEEEAGKQKNAAWSTVEKMRKDNNPKEDIAQAVETAQQLDKVYQSFAEKKRDAQRRARENQVSNSSSSGVSLQGAIEAFKKAAGREPTAAEVENIKKGYGVQ